MGIKTFGAQLTTVLAAGHSRPLPHLRLQPGGPATQSGTCDSSNQGCQHEFHLQQAVPDSAA